MIYPVIPAQNMMIYHYITWNAVLIFHVFQSVMVLCLCRHANIFLQTTTFEEKMKDYSFYLNSFRWTNFLFIHVYLKKLSEIIRSSKYIWIFLLFFHLLSYYLILLKWEFFINPFYRFLFIVSWPNVNENIFWEVYDQGDSNEDR